MKKSSRRRNTFMQDPTDNRRGREEDDFSHSYDRAGERSGLFGCALDERVATRLIILDLDQISGPP